MFLITIQSFAETPTTTKTATSPCINCGISNPEQWIAFSPILLFVLLIIIIFWKLNKEEYKIGDALKENITIEVSEDNPAIAEKPKPASTGVPEPVPVPVPAPVPVPVPVPTQPIANTVTATPFVPRTIQPKSTSRLIAFISGIVSVGIASSLCSFWMYNYFKGYQNIDLTHLSNVLLALGIGVIPYAVNKISTSK